MSIVTEFAPVEVADDTYLDVVDVEPAVAATEPVYVAEEVVGLAGAARGVQVSMMTRW